MAGATKLAEFTVSYDANSNVASVNTFVEGYGPADNGTWVYGYDEANRLTSVAPPQGPATTYGYDGAGNRTSVKFGADPAVITTYDGAGHPQSASDGTTYQTDATGALTGITKGGSTEEYGYDSWGRLTDYSVTRPPSASSRYCPSTERPPPR